MVKALVLHSGGFDSSLSLYLAKKKYGSDGVISFGISYGQRHKQELDAAERVASYFGVKRVVQSMIPVLGWEDSSLLNTSMTIEHTQQGANSFVPGRNGLFMLTAAPFAKQLQARELYVGVMEEDGRLSGYPDCSEEYVALVEKVIQKDLQDDSFRIIAPLVSLNKEKALELAFAEGILEPLLTMTISCYQGKPYWGCRECPSCKLRNKAIHSFYEKRPHLELPSQYKNTYPSA